MDWRLTDEEFDNLHREFNFSVEACCDPCGKNGHANLRFYSAENSILSNDLTGQRIFYESSVGTC